MPNNEENTKGVALEATPRFIIWQVTLWDRFAKVSPLILLIITGALYLYGFRNWELLIDSFLIMCGVVFSVWWFWVIYTIAVIAYVIEKSRRGLEDIMKDIHSVRTDIKDLIYRNDK